MRLLIFLLCSLTVNAIVLGQISNFPDGAGSPMRQRGGEAIDGNMYLTEDWCKGKVHWKNEKVSEDVFMKYNAYSGNLEVKNVNGEVWEFKPNFIKSFEYDLVSYPDVETVYFEPASGYFPDKKGFVKVLFKDQVVFLERIDIEFISSAPSYGASTSTVTKIIQKPKAFLILPGEKEPKPLRRSNSGLNRLMSNASLKAYLKNKSLDITNSKDVPAIMGFIKTLYL